MVSSPREKQIHEIFPGFVAAVLALTPAISAHAHSRLNSTSWISSLGSSNGELSSGLAEGISPCSLSSGGSSLPETHQDFSRNYGASLAAIDTTFEILGLLGDKPTIFHRFLEVGTQYLPIPY